MSRREQITGVNVFAACDERRTAGLSTNPVRTTVGP